MSMKLLSCSQQGTPLWVFQALDGGSSPAFSSFGGRDQKSAQPGGLGFTGLRRDPVNGQYQPGNGYRSYHPGLRRFTCPDNLSPFDGGGINPYVYCAGDPVNRIDPSGHISFWGWLGIGLGVLGAIFTGGAAIGAIAAAGGVMAAISGASASTLILSGLGAAADVAGIVSGATEDSNPGLSSALGIAAVVAGGIGLAFSAIAPVRGLATLFNKPAKGVSAELSSDIELRSISSDSRRVAVTDETTSSGTLTNAHGITQDVKYEYNSILNEIQRNDKQIKLNRDKIYENNQTISDNRSRVKSNRWGYKDENIDSKGVNKAEIENKYLTSKNKKIASARAKLTDRLIELEQEYNTDRSSFLFYSIA